MTVKLFSNEKIAETSSKGNQEKWYDNETNKWYKLDQFGYEALSEVLVSRLLGYGNINSDTPFTFVKYDMEKLNVHRRERNGCSSDNFLKENQSIETLSHILGKNLGTSLVKKLASLSSDKKRIAYLADATKDFTNLEYFPKYLTLLFEIDALFLNDDRHLNNIAVIEENGKYDYCPIFDNGAALLSNTQISSMDIEPLSLVKESLSKPFNISFSRQKSTAEALYGKVLDIPKFTKPEIINNLQDILPYYPERDRGIITDRVIASILKK